MFRVPRSPTLRNIRIFAQVRHHLTSKPRIQLERQPNPVCIRNFRQQIRWCTDVRAIKLEPKINEDLENEFYKPRHHPGRVSLNHIAVPERIVNAIKLCLEGKQFAQHLLSSHFKPFACISIENCATISFRAYRIYANFQPDQESTESNCWRRATGSINSCSIASLRWRKIRKSRCSSTMNGK